MQSSLIKLIMLSLVSVLLIGCNSENEQAEDNGEEVSDGEVITLTLAHILPASDIHAQAADIFAEEVAELSDGRVEVEVFPDGSLGADMDMLQGLEIGTTDIWMGGSGNLNSFSDTAKIFTVPFMFDDQEQFESTYNGEIGEEISTRIIEESGKNIISYWTRGPRWLTVNKEVNSIEDLAGMKIRVPDSPVFVQSWERLGTSPTPMDFGEVYTSLQQGVIDGQENPLSLIHSSRFSEVLDYLVRTEHVLEPIVLVVDDDSFNELDPEIQDIITQAANGRAQQFVADEVAKGEDEFLQLLLDEGMVLVEPDKEIFRSKLEGFVSDEFPEIQEIYDMITNQ